MKETLGAIELLQHSRHDWMNRLQVIKGNLELDNPDRAKEVIEEIIIEMRQEAQLSSLGAPRLSEWLLTYNWLQRARLVVRVEILAPGKVAGEMDGRLYGWLKNIVDQLESAVPDTQDNELYVSMEINEGNESLTMTLEYEGGPINVSPQVLIGRESESATVEWLDESHEQFMVRSTFYPSRVSK